MLKSTLRYSHFSFLLTKIVEELSVICVTEKDGYCGKILTKSIKLFMELIERKGQVGCR